MERSDFSSLRVLVLGGKTHTIGILRSILSNAGVTKINVGREGLHLLSVNEHGHLEGAAPAGSPSLLSYR